MGEIAVAPKRSIRLPVGLLLSTGAPKPERGPGRPIDHFRPKEGKVEQYSAAAAAFTEHYGAEPKTLDDLYFLSNEVPDALDIRLAAFSESGIRGIGQTNFATIMDESEFEDRVFGANAFTDDFLFFPKDVDEVRAELRENWEGEPIPGRIEGRDDVRIERLGIKIVATLEFCLPEIMGLGTVGRISTSSRNSIRNLYKGMWTEWHGFGYQLAGIPFRLSLRPKSTQRFDRDRKVNGQKKPGMVATTVYELIIDTPHTVAQLREALEMHRQAFGAPSRARLELEGRVLKDTLALPMAGEEERTREEALAETPDPTLNRIATLEAEVDDAKAISLMLLGAFGVESSAELSAEQAERYVAMLERAVPAEEVVGELVEDSPEGPLEDAAVVVTSDEEGSRLPSPSGDTSPVESSMPATETTGEELPGEPGIDPKLVEMAGDTIVPIGQQKNKALRTMTDEWLTYVLGPGRRYLEPHPAFVEALEIWVRATKPELLP